MTGRRDDSQELPRFSADAEMIRRPVTLGNVARNPSGARFAVGPPNKFEMLQQAMARCWPRGRNVNGAKKATPTRGWV